MTLARQYTDVSNYTANKNKGQRFPVDTRTAHMDGRTFEGPQGLKKILMEDKKFFPEHSSKTFSPMQWRATHI